MQIDHKIQIDSSIINRFIAILAVLLILSSISVQAWSSVKRYTNPTLINQDGEPRHFYDDVIKGKVVAINFMFTSCEDSCPLETAKLRRVQEMLGDFLGKNVFMYSITVDPEVDTPEVLKAYMEKFDVDPGWEFLTGKKADIDLLRKRLGMYTEGEDDASDHTISFILGNEKLGKWVRRTPYDVPESLVAVLLNRLQVFPLLPAAMQKNYSTAQGIPEATKGSDLFLTRCAICHSIGEGEIMGPDLLGVTKNRDPKWLHRWIKEPDVMLREKDPLAVTLYEQYKQIPMPNLKLRDQDVQDIIDHIEYESARVSKGPSDTPPHPEKTGHHHHKHQH